MSGVSIDTNDLEKGLVELDQKVSAALGMYADTAALKLQNYARDKASWVDRTGAARQRLTGEAEEVEEGYKLVLSHGVDYGIWLELANEKNYAILDPTIKAMSPEILRGFSQLLERLT